MGSLPATESAPPPAGLRRYRALLRGRELRTIVVAGLVGRLPLGMLSLAFVLLLRADGRSYADAGLIVAVSALAEAALSPILGRLVDRLGQPRVLIPLALAYWPLLGVFVVLVHAGAGVGLLCAMAFVAGATLPPLSACVRALLPTVLSSPELTSAAYALEASLQELIWIAGPLLVAVLATTVSPVSGVMLAGACGTVGALVFALTPAARRWRGRGRGSHGSRLGPLVSPGVRTMLIAEAGLGAMFGAVEVAMPAFGEAYATRADGALALIAWAVGSLLGGLIAGSRPPRRSPRVRYLTMATILALLTVPLIFVHSLWLMVAALLIAGLPIAPGAGAAFELIDELAPGGTRTEAFAWTSMALVVGYAAGTALAGVLIHAHGVATAFAFATAAVVVALLAVLARRSQLVPGGGRASPGG